MKRYYLTFAGMLLIVFAHAQQNQQLKSLINESFGYLTRIQELQKAVEVSELRVELTQSNYYPVIMGTASYTYLTPINQINFGAGEIKFQPNNNYNFNVSLTQPIWDFGKTKAQLAKSKIDLLSANINVDHAKSQLAAQVAGIFYSIIYLEKAVAVEDSILAILHVNKTIIENRIAQGDALRIDLTNVQSNIDMEQNRRVDFATSLLKQKTLLEYATGKNEEIQVVEFDFNFADEQAPLKDAAANNFDLLLANQRLEASKTDLALAQKNRYPTLTLNGGFGYRNAYQPDLNEMRFNYLIGASLSVPIYNAGKVNENIRIAYKTLEMNQTALKTNENNLRRDLKQVELDISSNVDRIKNSVSQLANAKEALTLAQSRYKLGTATYVDLLNASSNLQRTLLSQFQFQYQLCLARIELARLAGLKFWLE